MSEKSIEVDAVGLGCPMPLIKLKQALSQNDRENTQFILKMNDKGGLKDVPAFCELKALSYRLVVSGDLIEFTIKRL